MADTPTRNLRQTVREKRVIYQESAGEEETTDDEKVISGYEEEVSEDEKEINNQNDGAVVTYQELVAKRKQTHMPLLKEHSVDFDDDGGTYRELIAKRRQMHMSFLHELGVDSALGDISSFVPSPKPNQSQQKRKKLALQKNVEGPLRKSSRLQKILVPKKNFVLEEIEAKPKRKKVRGAVSFSVAAKHSNELSTGSFAQEWQFLEDEKPVCLGSSIPLSQYERKFETMRIQDSFPVPEKLTYSRIYSISVHPSASKLLFALGSKDGEVSFCDVKRGEKSMPLVFVPHSERVSCVHFSPYSMCEVYTCSYDGTMRCGNLTEGVFTEVFQASPDDDDDTKCTSFDFQSPSTFLVSLSNGSVTLVDKRTKNVQGEKDCRTCEHYVKSVSVHPTKSDYFVVIGQIGIASVWDLRGTMKRPVFKLEHEKRLSSAYFSPVTGNRILTTSLNDRLCVFDCSSLTDVKLKKAISHDHHHTGGPVRAVWLPKCDEGFMVGCTGRPRCIQVFNINGKLCHSFHGDGSASPCNMHVMHPLRPALATATWRKMCLFLGREEE